MIRRPGWALCLIAAGACGSDSPSGSGGVITVENGANQTAPVGTALQPYSVKVSNGSGAVDGLTVSWQVVSGGGNVSADHVGDRCPGNRGRGRDPRHAARLSDGPCLRIGLRLGCVHGDGRGWTAGGAGQVRRGWSGGTGQSGTAGESPGQGHRPVRQPGLRSERELGPHLGRRHTVGGQQHHGIGRHCFGGSRDECHPRARPRSTASVAGARDRHLRLQGNRTAQLHA